MADSKSIAAGLGWIILLSTFSTAALAVIALCFLALFPSRGMSPGFLSETAAWVLLVASVVALLACLVKLYRIDRERLAGVSSGEGPGVVSPLTVSAGIFTLLCMAIGYIPLFIKAPILEGAEVPVWPWLAELAAYARYGVTLGFIFLGLTAKVVGDEYGRVYTKTRNPFYFWFNIGFLLLTSALLAYVTA